MKLYSILLLLLVLTHASLVNGARGGGGARARISVRYSSYRYSSYRYSSYRYSSYRYSSYSSGYFRTSNYAMAPMYMRSKGGYYGNKQMLFVVGSVYIAHSMRPRFYVQGRGWRYSGDNYDEFAVCVGNITAMNAQNATTDYMYFLCPSDLTDIFKYDDKYCCGPAQAQHCCDEEGFYQQYGTPVSGASVAAIAVGSVVAILFLCGCCGLLIYCNLKRRMHRYEQPPQQPKAPNDGSAYPLHPVMPPAPQQQPQFAGPGFQQYEKLPGQPEPGSAPYPQFQPQQQLPPGVLPPPYPGPM